MLRLDFFRTLDLILSSMFQVSEVDMGIQELYKIVTKQNFYRLQYITITAYKEVASDK